MCGRYTIAKPERMAVAFDPDIDERMPAGARYNVAPMQAVPVFAEVEERKVLFDCQWGLVPSWAKDPSIGSRLINARSETVDEKPSYRGSFRHHRCLIPADGFYEWKKGVRGKQPYHIQVRDGEMFAFAGLYSIWTKGGDEQVIPSCTILTTKPNRLMKSIHNRMPVILPREKWAQWMDIRNQTGSGLKELMQPCDPAWMTAFPVSRYVNSPAHDDASCIAQIDPGDNATPSLFPLS